MILRYKHYCYEDRLALCQLSTLEGTTLRGDLLQVFKLPKGLDQINYNNFFVLDVNTSRRGHTLKVAKPCARLTEFTGSRLSSNNDDIMWKKAT